MVHGGLHFPCSVTTLVTRRVRPGRERDYEAWLRELSRVARGFPGHLGVVMLGPHGGPPSEYSAIFSFDTTDNLARWMRSPERREWLDRAAEITLDDGDVETLTGLEPWFVLPARTVSQPPPKWKMALLTGFGVFPLLLLVKLAMAPLVGSWPWPVALAAQLAVGIPLMTWFLMPGLSRLAFSWLYPEPRSRRSVRPLTPSPSRVTSVGAAEPD